MPNAHSSFDHYIDASFAAASFDLGMEFAVAYDVHSPYVDMEILELGDEELTVSKGTVVIV
jgi:hypothetical protein